MTALTLHVPSPRQRVIFGNVLRNEARLTWRQPVGLVGGLALPVALIMIFGNISTFHHKSSALGGLTPFEVYVPVVIMLGIALIAMMALSMPLVSYREQGILRRLSTTPMPSSWLLAAQVVVQASIAVASTLAVLIVSMVAFGAPSPRSPGGVAVAVLLSIAGLCPLGLLVASFAKTANGASVIGRLMFFPMMFFAGLWLPRAEMPTILRDISNYTPLGAAVQAIQDAILQGFPPATPLLVLAGYAVVLGYLAHRFFRWE